MNLQDKFNAALQKEADEAKLARKFKAKHKIQIWFKSDRSLTKPIAFSLSAWQSGLRLHGGGDEMMFICRRHEHAPLVNSLEVAPFSKEFTREPGKKGCGMFIPGENNVNGRILCPHCGTSHGEEHIGDAVFYRLSADKAAQVLVSWFHKLGGNADLYAKYSPQDPRTVIMSKSYTPVVAREKKGLTIYPLKNILSDTSNGSSLESRFKAFILA